MHLREDQKIKMSYWRFNVYVLAFSFGILITTINLIKIEGNILQTNDANHRR